MAARRFGKLIGYALATMVAAFVAACGAIDPSAAPTSGGDAQIVPAGSRVLPTPTAKPNLASNAPPRSATVKKDVIAETMSLDSLIVAPEQVTISYPGRGIVADVKVKAGQVVAAGDVLLELDSADLVRTLDAAKLRLEASTSNLMQGGARAAADQRSAAERLAAAQAQQQVSIADAQAGLRKAQSQLAVVMAGAPEADRRTAQAVLANAQSELQRAQAAQDKVAAGPDPGTLRTAASDAASASIVLERAQADLEALVKGADPTTLGQAQRELERAQTQLQLAQTAKPDSKADPNAAKLARDSAIADATFAVQSAQDRLAKLKQPPSSIDVQSARLRVQTAQDVLTATTDRLGALQDGPDQASVDVAQAAVKAAQQNVADAQARLGEVNRRPSAAEAAAAQADVAQAQAKLDAARNATPQLEDPGGVDMAALQGAVDRDQAEVTKIELAVQENRVTAPFSGTVLSVRAKVADPITSSKPLVTMAKSGPAIVRAQLADEQVGRLTVGQKADLVLNGATASDPAIDATVASVTPAPKNGTGFPSADFTVDWPANSAPTIGTPVQVNLVLQEKHDVLVVPPSAIRQAGARRYVEVLDGTRRHVTNVEVGIASADRVEVVSGVTEGQVVSLS